LDRAEKWAISATTLSLVFAVLGVLCYLFSRGIFMGELPEVVLVGVIVIFWSGALPVIMDPANSIAVGYTDHLNANLYFSSWLSFFIALWIAGALGKELYGMDLVGMASPVVRAKRGKWYGLIATSCIVLGSSIRVLEAFRCSMEVMAKSPVCRQTKYAISAGAIGTFFALVATFCLARASFSRQADWYSSVIMVIIWSFGLGFITFGDGPGQNIGNLYFATWGSFILSVLLVAESFREYVGLQQQGTTTNNNNGENGTEMSPNAYSTSPRQSFEDADI